MGRLTHSKNPSAQSTYWLTMTCVNLWMDLPNWKYHWCFLSRVMEVAAVPIWGGGVSWLAWNLLQPLPLLQWRRPSPGFTGVACIMNLEVQTMMNECWLHLGCAGFWEFHYQNLRWLLGIEIISVFLASPHLRLGTVKCFLGCINLCLDLFLVYSTIFVWLWT